MQTFTEYFTSINWQPLEEGEILKFRAPHCAGWEVAKMIHTGPVRYEATYRSAYAPDDPDFVAGTAQEMARWLFLKGAYVAEA